MLELEAAQERVLARIEPLGTESLPLAAAAGRFVAHRVIAPLDLPPFDNSAMDGYAVRADDVTSAGSEHPVELKMVGRIAAGEVGIEEVRAGTCIRLFTGSPLPAGADAVVMQEDTQPVAERPGAVQVRDRVRPWENVRLRGEDIKAGAVVCEEGESLTAGRAGLLAALGLTAVTVRRRPRIGVIATGTELREGGMHLQPGQIYESNRLTLQLLSERVGAIVKAYPIVRDDLSETEAMLGTALDECDAIVTAGGVSVGEFDFVKAAITRLGGTLDLWRVAIKPGKPFVLGNCRAKIIFGLPGNPVSAFVTFLLLVRPALLRWQGASNMDLPKHPGVMAEGVSNQGDRRHFIRVRADESGKVHLAGPQASHMLGSLSRANGLIDVPPETVIASGETVSVLRWD